MHNLYIFLYTFGVKLIFIHNNYICEILLTNMFNVADVLVDEDVQVLDIDEGEVGRVQVCMEAGIYNFYFFLFFHLFFSFFLINCFIEPPKERVGVKNEQYISLCDGAAVEAPPRLHPLQIF